MANLYPFYYDEANGIKLITYPKNSSSAIFSTYGNWVYAPIFRNPHDYAIKLNSLISPLGITCSSESNIATGKFVICFSNLGNVTHLNNLPEAATIQSISGLYDLPIKGYSEVLSDAVYPISGNIVVPANAYFICGIFAVRTSTYKSYLNIGCVEVPGQFTNQLGETIQKRPLYYKQRINTADLSTQVNADRMPSDNHWNTQVPRMILTYEEYANKPIPQNTLINMKQGETRYIPISGYSGWTIKSISNPKPNNISCVREGNSLKVVANYINYADTNTLTSTITLKGNIDSATAQITVNVKIPTIDSCTLSNSTIRPTQTINVSGTTSDGLTPIVYSVTDNAGKLIVNTNKTIYCSAILSGESTTGWATSSSGEDSNISIVLQHPYNSAVKKEYKNKLTAKHFSNSEIKINLSSTKMYNIPGAKIYYDDNTIVTGGSVLNVNSNNFEASGNTLTIKNNVPSGSVDVGTAYLYSDAVVTKPISIDLIAFVNLNITPNDNSYRLPLFCYNENGKVRISPYSYPIRVLYPSTYDLISRNGFSRRDIVIENLEFGYDNGTYHVLDAQYYNKVFWLSEMLNDTPITEKEYLISFGIPDFVITDSQYNTLLLGNAIDDNLCVKFTVSYTKQNVSGETHLNVVINFSKYLNRIITFETNKYSNGEDIPGSVIKLPLTGQSHDDILANNDCGINNLFIPIRNILKVYFNQNISQTKIVNANQYGYVSNDADKLFIESLLSQINSLNSAINKDSSLRILTNVRPKIAIGDPIMWDDNLGYASDGRIYVQKSDSTASPWKELYNAIKNIQYLKKYRICYRNNGVTYKVKQKIANNEFDIMAWR